MHSPMQATLVMTVSAASGDELAAELVLDVNPDDVVEGLFGGGEAELQRAVGHEIARPAADDADDGRIGHALDPRGDGLACDAIERGNLLADGHRHSGHAETAPRPHGFEIHGAGMH